MSKSINPLIAEWFATNPKKVQKLTEAAVDHFISQGKPEATAQDAVQDAFTTILTKPAHERSFEREGSISKSRVVKLTTHALRDMLDHAGRDALGRAMGARTREEVKHRALKLSIPSDEHADLDAPLTASAYQFNQESASAVSTFESVDGFSEPQHSGYDFTDTRQPSAEEVLIARSMFDEMEALVYKTYRQPERIMFLIDRMLEGVGRNDLADMDGISKNTMAGKQTNLRKLMRKIPSLSQDDCEQALELIAATG